MQKLRRDKGFQQKPDICLHCGHCLQLSHRVVFVFARLRPPRMCSGARLKKKKKKSLGIVSHITYFMGGRLGAGGAGWGSGLGGKVRINRSARRGHRRDRLPPGSLLREGELGQLFLAWNRGGGGQKEAVGKRKAAVRSPCAERSPRLGARTAERGPSGCGRGGGWR